MKRRTVKLIAFLATPILLAALLLSYFNFRLKPVLVVVAQEKARVLCSEAINASLATVLAEEPAPLLKLLYDESGKVTLISCDSAAINRLRTRLSQQVLQVLQEQTYTSFFVPLGTLLDGETLSGRGPGFEVRLVPVGSATVDLSDRFTSAGINQSLYSLDALVCVHIALLVPGGRDAVEVSARVSLAQTVIVGAVPEVFVQR